MKRMVSVCLIIGLLLCAIWTTAAAQSVREEAAEFPSAVEDILSREANIHESERIPANLIHLVIDSCQEELAKGEKALVAVDTETVLKVDALKSCATVECTAEYVYATAFKRDVKLEWMYYLDGRVRKTVSYDYEERTARFETYTYAIQNDNNEIFTKTRVKCDAETGAIDVSDMFFGMAIAVVLCMVVTVTVRAVRAKRG